MDDKNKTSFRQFKEGNTQWLLLDASGKTLGRFASEVAKVLRGKHRPDYTPHADCGDGVVIINADKIVVSGKKAENKIYRYYTGHIGGMREVPYDVMINRKPDYVIRQAVEKMLPKNRLGRQLHKRLRIYAGAEHDMKSQNPIPVNC